MNKSKNFKKIVASVGISIILLGGVISNGGKAEAASIQNGSIEGQNSKVKMVDPLFSSFVDPLFLNKHWNLFFNPFKDLANIQLFTQNQNLLSLLHGFDGGTNSKNNTYPSSLYPSSLGSVNNGNHLEVANEQTENVANESVNVVGKKAGNKESSNNGMTGSVEHANQMVANTPHKVVQQESKPVPPKATTNPAPKPVTPPAPKSIPNQKDNAAYDNLPKDQQIPIINNGQEASGEITWNDTPLFP